MALREIRVEGDPVLTKVCKEVKEVLNKSGVKYNDKYIYGIKLNTKVVRLYHSHIRFLKNHCEQIVSHHYYIPILQNSQL